MGEFVANVLIDLADPQSDFWTGRYNYAILGMSKTDDTEFRQFHQKIEKLTKDMDDYEKSKGRPIRRTFTIKDGKGKEYIYRVKLDGYMHGVVLEKIDKAKYANALRNATKGGNNGKSLANITRRARNNRTGLGGNVASNGGNIPSNGNTGYGGMGSGAPGSNTGRSNGNWNNFSGTVSGGKNLNSSNENDADGNTLSKQQQTYFEKSVVRDQNGQLLVMYHGTADATVLTSSRNGAAKCCSVFYQSFKYSST